jgi:peroxiredoxin
MTTITLKGNAIQTSGKLPVTGRKAKDFGLIATVHLMHFSFR